MRKCVKKYLKQIQKVERQRSWLAQSEEILFELEWEDYIKECEEECQRELEEMEQFEFDQECAESYEYYDYL